MYPHISQQLLALKYLTGFNRIIKRILIWICYHVDFCILIKEDLISTGLDPSPPRSEIGWTPPNKDPSHLKFHYYHD